MPDSDRQLMRDLQLVRRAAPPPPEEHLYRYLEAVYRLDVKWRERANQEEVRTWMARYSEQNFHHRLNRRRFRFIIEVTAPGHISARMKWKYATALERAQKRKVSPNKLREFMRKHGGLNGVVEL